MKRVHNIILSGILMMWSVKSYSQENNARMLTMQDAFDLAAKNSAQLKVAEINTDLARQKVEIAKLGQLPQLSTGFDYGYLSNSQIWDPSFDKHATKSIPHNLTQFSVQAAEVIFKGGDVQSGAMVLLNQRLELRREFEPPLVIDSGGLASAKHLIAPL